MIVAKFKICCRSRVGDSVDDETGNEHRMMASTTVYVLEPGVSALGRNSLKTMK